MRLIDAYALINDIEELITEHEEMRRDSKAHPENYPEDYKTRVLNLIAGLITAKVEVYNAPTIDAEPKHGEWIKDTLFGLGVEQYHGFKCSVCNEHTGNITNYCPNCGAKMRGDTE